MTYIIVLRVVQCPDEIAISACRTRIMYTSKWVGIISTTHEYYL